MEIQLKLSRTEAIMALNTRDRPIYVDKAKSFFIAQKGVKNGCVYVPREQILVPLEDITKIEVTLRLFGEESKDMATVNWEE